MSMRTAVSFHSVSVFVSIRLLVLRAPTMGLRYGGSGEKDDGDAPVSLFLPLTER